MAKSFTTWRRLAKESCQEKRINIERRERERDGEIECADGF